MLPSCATGAGQIFVYIFLTRVPRWTAPFSLSLNKYLSSFFFNVLDVAKLMLKCWHPLFVFMPNVFFFFFFVMSC